jgi:hypothetical protein
MTAQWKVSVAVYCNLSLSILKNNVFYNNYGFEYLFLEQNVLTYKYLLTLALCILLKNCCFLDNRSRVVHFTTFCKSCILQLFHWTSQIFPISGLLSKLLLPILVWSSLITCSNCSVLFALTSVNKSGFIKFPLYMYVLVCVYGPQGIVWTDGGWSDTNLEKTVYWGAS